MVADAADLDDVLDRVAQRIEFLDLLSDGEWMTNEIVEELPHSRSTVSRALRQLQETDLIEKRANGYTVTQHGGLLTEQYRDYESEARSILGARHLLESLPDEEVVAREFVANARTIGSGESPPFRPLEVISNQMTTAQRVHAYLPTLSGTHFLRVFRRLVVEERGSLNLFVSPELGESLGSHYPGILGELANEGDFQVQFVDGPSYGIVVSTAAEKREATVTVYSEAGAMQGGLATEDDSGVEWALERVRELESAATDRTEDFEASSTSEESRLSPLADESPHTGATSRTFPLELREGGFELLSEADFESDGLPPDTALRVGLSFGEIDEGLAVDRTIEADDGEERSLTSALVDQLREGTDTVLLGPPGSGKSTVCKMVAHEWYARDRGPVVYREADHGRSFESVAVLEDYLQRSDGHTLVVVEDALRLESRRILSVVETFKNDGDVTFLLDSRQREWDDPTEPLRDARLNSVRRQVLSQVSMPELTESEAQSLVDTAAQATDGTMDLDGRAIVRRVHDANRTDDEVTPGEMFLAQQFLVTRLDSMAPYETSTATTFEEDVLYWYDRFVNAESDCLGDLALLVNIFNAAGLPIAPELLYSLSVHYDTEAVSRGLEKLEGTLLFESTNRRFGLEYRTNSEIWSARFLEQFVRSDPDPSARFERCIQPVVSLVDERERRDRVSKHLDHSAPHLSQIKYHPGTWSEEFLTRLFQVGLTHYQLAPMFGTSTDAELELPSECSDVMAARISSWRARMYRVHGMYDEALAEYEMLERRLDSLTELRSNEVKRLRCDCLSGRASVRSDQGKLDEAAEFAEEAIRAVERGGLDDREPSARLDYAHIAYKRADFDAALDRYETCIEAAERVGDKRARARALTASGAILSERGKYDRANQRYKQALGLSREINDRRNEANTLGNMGVMARDRNELERALDRFREKLRLAREVGERHTEANALWNIASVESERGNLETAVDHAAKALELSREVDVRRVVTESLHLFGEIERQRGNLEQSRQYAEDSLDAFEASGYKYGVAAAYRNLARVELAAEHHHAAQEHVEAARTLAEEMETEAGLAACDEIEARIAYQEGRLETAAELAQAGLETYRSTGRKKGAAETLRVLSLVAFARGDSDRGRSRLDEAAELAREAGVQRTIDRVERTRSRYRTAKKEQI
ncbi:tetratricopeptide repeat protein [Halorussus marinus]|uniref:tetratricopeptide repeat protein n=1 Tax=Halorussus marinus TaxID=2505976 RepID=UPI001092509A|nr:tetratricopeptide repeat protein [Halorussus marinus]